MSSAIVVATPPRGVFQEGLLKAGETAYPGMILQRDPSVAEVGGNATYKIFNRDADGDNPAGGLWVVRENYLLGQGDSVAYDSTQNSNTPVRIFLYQPVRGEEVRLLLKNIAGTGDDHTKGEILMVDDESGKLIATTGTPETEVAMLLETVTDPTADTLALCEWAA